MIIVFGSINWRFLSFLARMEFNVNGNTFGKSPGRRRRFVTKQSRKIISPPPGLILM